MAIMATATEDTTMKVKKTTRKIRPLIPAWITAAIRNAPTLLKGQHGKGDLDIVAQRYHQKKGSRRAG